jgi:hypothetical protein
VPVAGDTVEPGGGDQRHGGVQLGSGYAARLRLPGLFSGLSKEQFGRAEMFWLVTGPLVVSLSGTGVVPRSQVR